MLLCIRFTLHPLAARVKEANVELLVNNAPIVVLRPESVDDDESSRTVRQKLSGEFKIGYAPAGVEGTVGVERESEREQKSERRVRGSGVHTCRAVWTLRENAQNKKGIHLSFVAVLVVQSKCLISDLDGGLKVDLEVRAKLGPSSGDALRIRRILARSTKSFDGKTLHGFRPATLDISDTFFVKTDIDATS
ncbi:hypothetical protein ANO11243_094300 [Dothideomycetidae sp. 11243]|nr:hypothetical protein ANO11243_094300 [fungal sp. No.11243]